MTDLQTLALDLVEQLERGNIEAVCDTYAQTLPPSIVAWLRSGGWAPHLESSAGLSRRIPGHASSTAPGVVAVIVEGSKRRVAVRVRFDENGRPAGLGVAEWPLSSPLRNIVVSCPPDNAVRATLWAFYRNLLSMSPGELRRPVVAIEPVPAFRPPRWPDPAHPQQLHVDFFVRDVEASERVALRSGATLLADQGRCRTYADPVGHPFCLYPDPLAAAATDARARVGRIVTDCPDPRALSRFYAGLLKTSSSIHDDSELVVLAFDDDTQPQVAFQRVDPYHPPRWPDPEHPAQVHLDLHFEDDEAARSCAERLGAVRMPGGGSCPVYSDPAGHPFCLCAPGQ